MIYDGVAPNVTFSSISHFNAVFSKLGKINFGELYSRSVREVVQALQR